MLIKNKSPEAPSATINHGTTIGSAPGKSDTSIDELPGPNSRRSSSSCSYSQSVSMSASEMDSGRKDIEEKKKELD